MANWILEVVKVGPHYIIRPPVCIEAGEVILRAEDKLTEEIGQTYDYPTDGRNTVISNVRMMLENLPKEQTQTP